MSTPVMLHGHPVTMQGVAQVLIEPVEDVEAATTVEVAVPVPGVAVGDLVLVFAPGITEGLALGGARVEEDDAVLVTLINVTAGALTAFAGLYTFLWFRP